MVNKRTEKQINELLEKYKEKWYTSSEKKAFIEELIRILSPFIENTVNRYIRKYPQVTKDDLYQEALLGVVIAVDKFDLEKSTKFVSYLYHWIRVRIERFIAKNLTVVSAPLNLVHVYSNKKKSKSEDELIRKYRITKRYLKKINEYEQIRVYSLEPDKNNEEVVEKVSKLPAPELYSPEEVCSREEMYRTVSEICMKFLLTLDKKEQYVFCACLYTDKPRTATEVGKELGISKERVRQIKESVKRKFKEFFYQHVSDAEAYRVFV